MAEPTWSFEGTPKNGKTETSDHKVPNSCAENLSEEVYGNDTEASSSKALVPYRRDATNKLNIEGLPMEVHKEIFGHIIGQTGPRPRINANMSTVWSTDETYLTDGLPEEFQRIKGLFAVNRSFGSKGRNWLYDTSCFVASEPDFHRFPTVFGVNNLEPTKIRRLELELKENFDRTELHKALIKDMPNLEQLQLRDGPRLFSDVGLLWMDLVGDRYDSLRSISFLVHRHPGLNRAAILPDIADEFGVPSRYVLDRGYLTEPGDARWPRFETSTNASQIVGHREEPQVLNTTAIRHMAPDLLRNSTIDSISIKLSPDRAINDVFSSELKGPASHYAVMDRYGYMGLVADGQRPDANDQLLYDMLKEVDNAPNPVQHLMEERVRLTLALRQAEQDRKTQEEEFAKTQRRLEFDLDDAYWRLSEIDACSQEGFKGKRKLRQVRNRLQEIGDLARTPQHTFTEEQLAFNWDDVKWDEES